MSKMSQLHAELPDNGNLDDSDWDAPSASPFVPRQRVRFGSVAGWVEVVEPKRIGVRFVNGNFRWCRLEDVRPDPVQTGDLFGEGRP